MSEVEALANRLRRTTRPLHVRLDAHPLMQCLVAKSLTLDVYGLILRKFYGLYATFEEHLATRIDWTSLQIDFGKRRKAPLLERDLIALGVDPNAVERCLPLPLWSPSQGMGCFYVLEGATLGGQIISRNIALRLGLSIETGAAFFASYGSNVGMMWRGTLDALAQHEQRHQSDSEAVVGGACATFLAFAEWLDAVEDGSLKDQEALAIY